jgi:hypothetical protein
LHRSSRYRRQRLWLAAVFVAFFPSLCIAAGAQQFTDPPLLQPPLASPPEPLPPIEIRPDANLLAQSIPLPNAPGKYAGPSAAISVGSVTSGPGSPTPEVSRTQKVIQPGEIAPSLSQRDKALLGVKNSFSAFAAAGWIAAAGYEQLMNGSPNFGTDRGAFGERLGAAVLRDSSEGILSDSAMAPLFREDPRYYRLGPAHKLPARVLYAITRPLIVRTDAGALSPNLALWSGTLGGATLTNAYYPSIDRGPAHTFEIFGGSLGGEAISDCIREFFGDVTELLHSQHE